MSVRKAQTDFFSPMTGNVFRDNRRRADLIMEAAKVDMIKTDDPFTQIAEKKSYYSPDDSRAITDAFDRDYGVLSDEEAATILEQNQEAIQQPTPVIDPEPTPTPTTDPEPTPEPETTPENTPEEAVEKATKYTKTHDLKKKGREAFMGNSKYKMSKRVAARNKAKAAAKARNAKKSSSSSSSRGGSSSSSAGSRSGRSQGRGGARGGAKGGSAGRGASSKGGTSRGGARTNRSRSRRRCDIRCKFDISLLSNINLVRDDLAELAYFVKEISN